MRSTSTVHASIDDGLDRKSLKTIIKRFMQVNQGRLARARLSLNRQQQVFIDLLPLLFHTSHPMLPGYVSHNTPRGVANYTPDKADLQRAQRLARSFTYRRNPNQKYQIDGIYLMGSCGTVAQSGVSDLDIWVSHPSELNAKQLAELQQKCSLLEKWASSLSLEVHFFLMDGEKFRKGERAELSTEDCGSAQHYLLLDEFYRTGLLIAGRPPIWWLVPASEEEHYEHYSSTLRKKRFVGPGDHVDFGGVPQIPAGEFIGAGIWQLYKGIDSPYKSVLKLLLTEVYASEFPNTENLSILFKQAIYNDQLDIDELDPYVMIYRRLERYLQARNEPGRLELIRRCFYFKVGKKLSRGPSQIQAVRTPATRKQPVSWQRSLMQKLVLEWGWSKEHLRNLDSRDQWKATQVIEERKELVRELTNSYRFLIEFARINRTTALINTHEMNILGRKLYAAFERKAGKIELINPGIASNLAEENLSFCQTSSHKQTAWAVYPEAVSRRDQPQGQPFKRSQNLLELIAWCHFNGILKKVTQVDFLEGAHDLQDFELNNIIRSLQHLMPATLIHQEKENHVYSRTAYPVQILLFINVGIDPLQRINKHGLQRLSNQVDSLDYSGLRDNLILNIEQLSLNSWGEITCARFEGNEALLRCVKDYIEGNPPDNKSALPRLDIRCFCPSRASAISQRVEELFRDIVACYYSGTRPSSSRYIVQIQSAFYTLQYRNQVLDIQRAANYSILEQQLGERQREYSPIVLDRYALNDSVLKTIIDTSKPDAVQVFYQRQEDFASIYVVDESGSLFSYTTPFVNEQTLLNPLSQFLKSTLYRQNSMQLEQANAWEEEAAIPLHRHLRYFEILQTPRHGPRAQGKTVDNELNCNYFNVQAIAERDQNDLLVFNIYCDHQEFTSLEWGDQLYSAVARFILARRSGSERYPCYITDLDLSGALIPSNQPGAIQTIDYLRYKHLLERGLNNALQAL
jgi:adenylate cyclase class 1